MDETLNGQATTTSTGAGWLDLIKTGIKVGADAAIANNTARPATTQPVTSEPLNMKLILGIGAGVLLLIVAAFAFKK